jgi:hypothetical protein
MNLYNLNHDSFDLFGMSLRFNSVNEKRGKITVKAGLPIQVLAAIYMDGRLHHRAALLANKQIMRPYRNVIAGGPLSVGRQVV